jgi:type I restriction enzyme, S subunit
MSSPWFLEEATRASDGTRMPRAPWSALGELPVSLPPEPRRGELSSLLSLLARRAALARAMNDTLEALARALLARELPGLAEALASGTPRPGQGTLSDLVVPTRRQVALADLPGETPYVGLEHLPRTRLSLDTLGEASQVASHKVRFARGQLLFGRLRPALRKAALAPLDGVCSPDILVLSPAEPLLGPVAALSIRSPSLFAHADRSATGTRMPRVSWSDLGRFPMPLPPPAALRAFGGLASPLLARLLANAALARSLEQLRDALLPRFLAG